MRDVSIFKPNALKKLFSSLVLGLYLKIDGLCGTPKRRGMSQEVDLGRGTRKAQPGSIDPVVGMTE